MRLIVSHSLSSPSEKMELVKLPLLILHGTADRLDDPEGSKQLYERAESKDKTLKLYDGFYHEVMNEPEKERVLADILEWLGGHLELTIVN